MIRSFVNFTLIANLFLFQLAIEMTGFGDDSLVALDDIGEQ